MLYHLDTDFFICALSVPGPERGRLRALSESDADLQMSAVAWYEFSRGPRTPGHSGSGRGSPRALAVARAFLGEEGTVSFSERLATQADEVFRRLGSPRRRAAGVAMESRRRPGAPCF